MRKLARRMLIITAPIAAASVMVLGTSVAANASTGNQVVVASATSPWGSCTLQLLGTWDGYGDDYAAARIIDNSSWWECDGVLQRSTDGGQTWTDVSGYHQLGPGQSVTTYNYWDGDGYLCRVWGLDYTNFPVVSYWTDSW
jgi:hypothetical protein